MATNWTAADAAKAIKSGNKEAIMDIGGRFPLFLNAVASNNLDAILAAIPENITARKIEAVMKDGVENTDEVAADDTDSEDEAPMNKPEPTKGKRGRKPKAKVEEVAEPEDDEEDDDAEDAITLYKQCKKAGLKVKPKQSVDYYKKELAKLEEADDEDEDDDDDWDI